MMLHLALSLLLSASGDVLIATNSAEVTLTGPQATTVGSVVTALYPGVALADVLELQCARRHAVAGDAGVPFCTVLRNEPITASALFAFLSTPRMVTVGPVAGARRVWLAPVQLAGGAATNVAALALATAPASNGYRIERFAAWRDSASPSVVRSSTQWARPYAQAALHAFLSGLTSGTEVVSLGLDP